MGRDHGRYTALAAAVLMAAATACGVEARPEGVAEETSARAGAAQESRADSRTPAVLVSDETAAPVRDSTKPTAEPVPANVAFADAEAVFRAGDYERAADMFEAYATRRPDNPWGAYMLGISAWRAGDHQRAELALRRTIEVDPRHGRGLINLARVLLEQRKASDALEVAELVVELDPRSGEGWRVLGNARSDVRLVEPAMEAYRAALVLDHRDAWTMNNLGLLMIREGMYDDALPPLARAVELRPDVSIFQNNLGVALERSGYLGQAAEAYRAALAANPGHERARVSLDRVEAMSHTRPDLVLDIGGQATAFSERIRAWQERESAFGPASLLWEPDTESEEDHYEC